MGVTSSTATINSSSGASQTVFGNFNMKLFIYVIAAIIIEAGVISYANSQGQNLLMAIFVPLSIYIFLVYGIRWFSSNGAYAKIPTGNWPPAINSCPDFLSAYNINGSQGVKITGCVDRIGISSNGGFRKVESSGIPNWPQPPTNPITASTTDSNGAAAYSRFGFFPTQVMGETPAALCKRLADAGLTWEGIYDGQNCLNSKGSDTSGMGIGGGSGSC